jgi:hypothetical protein
MGDEDLIDLHAIERIIGEGQRKRRVSFHTKELTGKLIWQCCKILMV